MGSLVALLAAFAAISAVAAVAVRNDTLVASRLVLATGPLARRSGAPVRVWVRRVGSNPRIRAWAVSRELQSRLASSGWDVSSDEVAGWKVVGASVGVLLGSTLPFPGPVAIPAVLLIAFRGPDIVIGRAVRARLKAADVEVPQLLDLLAAGSSAGLAAPLALSRATGAIRGPLAEELRSSLRAVDLGRRWRDELVALSDRLALPDLRRTVMALTRTEMLGASLSDTVSELAADVRATRAAATAERARKAPVKMLFPLVFLVLPAFLLLTVVPVLLSTIRSIS